MQDTKHGIAGGVEIGIGGTYYTEDGISFNESYEIGVFYTEAVYSLGKNKYAFVGNMNGREGPAISTSGGIFFEGHFWPKDFCPEAPARYGAFPSEKTWYITGGTWPQDQEEDGEDYLSISHRIRLDKKTGKFSPPKFHQSEPNNTYYAVIAKTTDAGHHWTKQYYSTGKFYFNEISCVSDEICMAVGEGFVQDGGEGGAHIFQTTNGGTDWTEIYTYGAAVQGSGIALIMLSEQEAWVGTTYAETEFKCGAQISHTIDGGKTWTQENTLKNVVGIMEFEFIDN